jgi:hypothetical protein
LIEVQLDSLFRQIFPCSGEASSLLAAPWELARNMMKLLRKLTLATPDGNRIRRISLIISLFAGKCAPRPRSGSPRR